MTICSGANSAVGDDGWWGPAPCVGVVVGDHSRAIAGYTVFLGDPTALQTALALRQAVWRKADPALQVCGLPAVLYSDHGGDFASDHIAQVCADVKVQLVHSTPGKPRGRWKVERLFGTITTEGGRCGRRCRHRFQQLPGGVGAAPVHPDQEIHAGQLRGSHRYQQGIRGQSTAALLHRADRTVQGLHRPRPAPSKACAMPNTRSASVTAATPA